MAADDQQEREYAATIKYLAEQLDALSRRPLSIRKRFLDHQIFCKQCDDVVVQIVALSPYRVVRYRVLQSDSELLPSEPRARLAAMAQHKRSIRLDKNWKFFPITDLESDAGRKLVYSRCRCGGHTFTVRGILESPGDRSTSSPTRHRNEFGGIS
jgi:hypothetical protein